MRDPKTQEDIIVALLYGGRSGEHEVSCVSAGYLYQNLQKAQLRVEAVWLDHDGNWFYVPTETINSTQLEDDRMPRSKIPCRLIKDQERFFLELETDRREINIAFPILHGSFGEDGKIQGYFETMGLPYTGSGVSGSATGMDKLVSRRIIDSIGLKQVPYLALMKYEFQENPGTCMNRIQQELKFPVFTKPANMGSSVGVNRVTTPEGLEAALQDSFEYDHAVIVEEGKKVREIETAVLGAGPDIRLSLSGEIIVNSDFYSYAAKYQDPDASRPQIPADLPEHVKASVAEMIIPAYRALNLSGYARADLFYVEAEDQLYFNEINTLPGFTAISMFPKLWEASGLLGPELVREIIELGFEQHKAQKNLKYKYTASN